MWVVSAEKKKNPNLNLKISNRTQLKFFAPNLIRYKIAQSTTSIILSGFNGEFRSSGANLFWDCLQFRLEVKMWSSLYGFIFTNHFLHCFKESTEEIEDSQSSVIFVSHLPTKIDIVKFDSTNNYGKWRCEMMDALMTSNLEDSLCLEEKLEETFEKDWNKMNWTMSDVIKSSLTQNIKYHVLYETSVRKM